MKTQPAIFFDLGETLFTYGSVDIHACFRQAARDTYAFLKAHQGQKPLPGFARYWLGHLLSIRRHVVVSALTGREFDCLALLDKKARHLGVTLNDDELLDLAGLWYEPLGRAAVIEHDLHHSFAKLRDMGFVLGLISNTFVPAAVLDRHLDRLGLLNELPVRVYSSQTVFRKPNRRIYLHAAQRLGADIHRSFMVGDKVIQDIIGPRRVGITGIFKRGTMNRRKRLPKGTPVIHHIAELPALLTTLRPGL